MEKGIIETRHSNVVENRSGVTEFKQARSMATMQPRVIGPNLVLVILMIVGFFVYQFTEEMKQVRSDMKSLQVDNRRLLSKLEKYDHDRRSLQSDMMKMEIKVGDVHNKVDDLRYKNLRPQVTVVNNLGNESPNNRIKMEKTPRKQNRQKHSSLVGSLMSEIKKASQL